jgi:DNA-binding transcriptional MerR regulator
MAWSIAQVARMSKASSRTLRHYDEIGLLPPAHVGGNGYRYYEQEQLLRLQRILLLRELGLGLDAIAKVVDGEQDQVEALRRHHVVLVAERARIARLARTVSSTIAQLEGGKTVAADKLFEGFDLDGEKQARYEAELVDRYGEEIRPHIEESKDRVRGFSKEKIAQINREMTEVSARIVALLDAGVPADDPRTLDVFEGHYQWICHTWTPNAESYTGLGELYVDSPEFRQKFDADREGLAEYLRDGMAAYARARLS